MAKIASRLSLRANTLVSSQLRRNIVVGTGAAALNASLSLVSYPIYLHFLGYHRYGVWLALSTVLTIAQLGNLGINPAVSKLVAESHGAKDISSLRGCLTAAWIVVSVSGTVAVGLVIALKGQIIELFRLTGDDARLMSHLLPYIALFSAYIFIVELLNAALVGLGRTDLESYYRTISQSVAILFAAILLAYGWGVLSLLFGNALAYVGMHILGVVAVRRTIGARLLAGSHFNFIRLTNMLGFGGWVFTSSLLNMTLSPLNRILISRYIGIAALPVYEIAFSSSMRIRSILEGGIRAMMPEISRISATITRDTLLRAATLKRAGARVIITLGIPIYAFLLLFASPLLKMWLGNRFQPEFPPVFRIMLLGSFFSLLCIPGYYILMGLGHAKNCFISSAFQWCASFLFIGLAFILTGTISLVTISVSVAVGMLVCCAYILWQIDKTTRRSSDLEPLSSNVSLSSTHH